MKTIALLGILLLAGSLSMANSSNEKDEATPNPYNDNITVYATEICCNYLNMPYGKKYKIPLYVICNKGKYTLYKCESCCVCKVSGCELKGNTQHYFVFKDGEFHLSVNECNQNAVYSYFTDQKIEDTALITQCDETALFY